MNVAAKINFANYFYLKAVESLYFVKTNIKKEDLSKRLDEYLKLKINESSRKN